MASTTSSTGPIPTEQQSQAYPTEAQIPLQRFHFPDIPPQASHLKALTLTSDIKLDEYSKELETYTPIPELPPGIENLTLELFSLGYPAGFLKELSERLPNVKSLVLYSQLIAGITEASKQDAVTFFGNLPNLRALHMLDVFTKPHFLPLVSSALQKDTTKNENISESAGKGLLFLELNYTFRHEDSAFLDNIPSADIPSLIQPSLITCALNIAPSEVSNDPQDPVNLDSDGQPIQRGQAGVMALSRTLSGPLVEALTAAGSRPRELRLLNTTLFTVGVGELRRLLEVHGGVKVLDVTVYMEAGVLWKGELLDALAVGRELEHVEIVGNPSLELYERFADEEGRTRAAEEVFVGERDVKALGEKVPSLGKFEMNVLRASSELGSCEWDRVDGEWKGKLVLPRQRD